MRIITFKRINDFVEKNEDSKVALQDWYHKTSKVKWNSLNDIKRTLNSTDYVSNKRFVFKGISKNSFLSKNEDNK